MHVRVLPATLDEHVLLGVFQVGHNLLQTHAHAMDSKTRLAFVIHGMFVVCGQAAVLAIGGKAEWKGKYLVRHLVLNREHCRNVGDFGGKHVLHTEGSVRVCVCVCV